MSTFTPHTIPSLSKGCFAPLKIAWTEAGDLLQKGCDWSVCWGALCTEVFIADHELSRCSWAIVCCRYSQSFKDWRLAWHATTVKWMLFTEWPADLRHVEGLHQVTEPSKSVNHRVVFCYIMIIWFCLYRSPGFSAVLYWIKDTLAYLPVYHRGDFARFFTSSYSGMHVFPVTADSYLRDIWRAFQWFSSVIASPECGSFNTLWLPSCMK